METYLLIIAIMFYLGLGLWECVGDGSSFCALKVHDILKKIREKKISDVINLYRRKYDR
jgi:hypothetical protein